MSWITPIYDRTQADVDLIKLDPTNKNNKGAYNYTDLNRIENNCVYVMNLLLKSGIVDIPEMIVTKTDWNMKDIPNINEINRIRNNITILKNNMNVRNFQEIEFANTMNYIKANILEKDLELIKEFLESLNKRNLYCNTFYCGSNGFDLYIKPTN